MLYDLTKKYEKPSARVTKLSKKILRDAMSSAEEVWHATSFILGGNASDLLGETRRKIFSDYEISYAASNLDKMNAIIALMNGQTAFWDAIVFEKTVLAFDGQENNPELLEEALPAQILYGLNTMLSLLKNTEAGGYLDNLPMCKQFADKGSSCLVDVLGSEVIDYVALMHYMHGCVSVLPEHCWASKTLSNMLPLEGRELAETVDARISVLPTDIKTLEDMEYPETRIGVQLARLSASRVYAAKKSAADVTRLEKLVALALD